MAVLKLHCDYILIIKSKQWSVASSLAKLVHARLCYVLLFPIYVLRDQTEDILELVTDLCVYSFGNSR